MEIEFEPDLGHNCIQSLAKSEFKQVQSELFRKGDDEYLQQKFEVLKLFLQSADFGKLRGEYEESLLEGKKVKFKIRSINGRLEFEWRAN